VQRFRRALETNPDQFKSERLKLESGGKSLPVFESLPRMGVRIWVSILLLLARSYLTYTITNDIFRSSEDNGGLCEY
jgi:hypothetical protein